MWADAYMGLASVGEKRGPGHKACCILLKKLVVDPTSPKGKKKLLSSSM